ncbi:MAG: hypothetical protein LM587_03540 [Candidatus Aenigmarchaeota archaeon]|nr:hypothetical protein [Candidatus Aenigmarchaeota archaeon]
MNLLQKDVPILTKIYEAKCFYDSQNNRIILYYKNHVTARTLVDVYNLPTTPPPNSSLYVIYDLQTGTFNVSTDPPTYTVSNSKVYVTSPINAEYDMDKVIIYRIGSYETTDIDLNYILTQLNTIDTDLNNILTQLNTFVRKQQADTITAIHTFDPVEPGPAFQLGPNAQNQLIRYLNADKVDGFDASQTPAPNVIVPLNPDGILDLSTTYIKSNVYTFRRVDLTGATSDYDLQLGEEAYYVWDTTVSTTLPLRIRVSGMLYEMIVVVPNRTTNAINLVLYPNNTTYSSAFQRTVIYPHDSSIYVYNWKDTGHAIFYEQVGGGGMLISWLQTTTTNKGEMHHMTIQHSNSSFSLHMQIAYRWNDTTTIWSSLGTLRIQDPNGIVYVSVRRLV